MNAVSILHKLLVAALVVEAVVAIYALTQPTVPASGAVVAVIVLLALITGMEHYTEAV